MMTMVPTVATPLPSDGAQRHDGGVDDQRLAARWRRAPVSGIRDSVAPSGVSRRAARSASTNGASKTSSSGAADGVGARHAVELLERAVPADDAVVEVDHQQAVVERLEDVLVERAQPIELHGLEVQLAVEPARSRAPWRSGRPPRSAAPMSSLLNGSSVSLRPSASTAIVPSFETQGTK